MNLDKAYVQGHTAFEKMRHEINTCTLGMPADAKKVFWTGLLAACFGSSLKDVGDVNFGEILNDVICATESIVEQAKESTQAVAGIPVLPNKMVNT